MLHTLYMLFMTRMYFFSLFDFNISGRNTEK